VVTHLLAPLSSFHTPKFIAKLLWISSTHVFNEVPQVFHSLIFPSFHMGSSFPLLSAQFAFSVMKN
jgi:hypothetical protein